MRKSVFLDRDGIINIERGEYTWKEEDFHFTEGIFESLKILQNKGYLLIIISNQGGIGKGLYSHQHLEKITELMKAEMKQKGVHLTGFYYCPHHPDFNGKCICRKPDSLLFEKALYLHNIEPNLSFMIGDKKRDIDASEKCGIKGFLVPANSALEKIVSLIP